MAYIQPYTDIYLCRVQGLDTTYKNTMYFPDSTQQLNYFLNRRVSIPQDQTLNKQNFIRAKKTGLNRVKIELPLSIVTKANYMIIRNDGKNAINGAYVDYEKQYLFAFIKDFYYVSEDVTEIDFEIDVIQTYLFDYEESVCMVEREHTYTDFIGEHIATEPIDTGAMKPVDMEEIALFNDYMIVVATAYTGS